MNNDDTNNVVPMRKPAEKALTDRQKYIKEYGKQFRERLYKEANYPPAKEKIMREFDKLLDEDQ